MNTLVIAKLISGDIVIGIKKKNNIIRCFKYLSEEREDTDFVMPFFFPINYDLIDIDNKYVMIEIIADITLCDIYLNHIEHLKNFKKEEKKGKINKFNIDPNKVH